MLNATSTQELDGIVNIIEDYKNNFEKDFEDYKKTQEIKYSVLHKVLHFYVKYGIILV